MLALLANYALAQAHPRRLVLSDNNKVDLSKGQRLPLSGGLRIFTSPLSAFDEGGYLTGFNCSIISHKLEGNGCLEGDFSVTPLISPSYLSAN